ncbi:hypothetical protein [Halalkalibacterium ligniniphilum]|nr:hypothetical protein [Halalkalibacterium ligniniphilum]
MSQQGKSEASAPVAVFDLKRVQSCKTCSFFLLGFREDFDYNGEGL